MIFAPSGHGPNCDLAIFSSDNLCLAHGPLDRSIVIFTVFSFLIATGIDPNELSDARLVA